MIGARALAAAQTPNARPCSAPPKLVGRMGSATPSTALSRKTMLEPRTAATSVQVLAVQRVGMGGQSYNRPRVPPAAHRADLVTARFTGARRLARVLCCGARGCRRGRGRAL